MADENQPSAATGGEEYIPKDYLLIDRSPQLTNRSTFSSVSELVECVREIASLWESHLDEVMTGSEHSVVAYSAPTESTPRGRPRFNIHGIHVF